MLGGASKKGGPAFLSSRHRCVLSAGQEPKGFVEVAVLQKALLPRLTPGLLQVHHYAVHIIQPGKVYWFGYIPPEET